MLLPDGRHLSYCANIHRGETWAETRAALQAHIPRVRELLGATDRPFAVGLRLSAVAARELLAGNHLADFRAWLETDNLYVFTINGFPFGSFHGTRVKEQVYAPDWSDPARAAYTRDLFEILVKLPSGGATDRGVSTLPGSFKLFDGVAEKRPLIQSHLRDFALWLEALSAQTGEDLHLDLEPEPLGLFENTAETIEFFAEMTTRWPAERGLLLRRLRVNYDTCHLAIEYEKAAEALAKLNAAGLRIGKLHLSSAVSLVPSPAAVAALEKFVDEVYLHQVIVREADGRLKRFHDLPPALAWAQSHAGRNLPHPLGEEWRVHFHIPLHAGPAAPFGDTRPHLEEMLALSRKHPAFCTHLEMETYTWEVLPPEMRAPDVDEQLAAEYRWVMERL